MLSHQIEEHGRDKALLASAGLRALIPLALLLLAFALQSAATNNFADDPSSNLPPLNALAGQIDVSVDKNVVSLSAGQLAAQGRATDLLESSGVRLIGVRAKYDGETVPYCAPYRIVLSFEDAAQFQVAMPDFGTQRWKSGESVAAEKQKDGSFLWRSDIGLTPNAADVHGIFWLALLPVDGEKSVPAPSGMKLVFPDAPAKGNPLDYHQEIVARDGIKLATNIYLPFAENNIILPDPPYPAILIRTPYDKSHIETSYIGYATRFNAVVITQYYRGRLDMSGKWPSSEGKAGLFSDHAGPEHYDAIDTVDWLEARPWYNRRLLATGPSALGLWIYQAAPQLGSRLSGMYPIVAAANVGRWAAFENGCYKQGNVEAWLKAYDFPAEYLVQARQIARDPLYWAGINKTLDLSSVNCPGLLETCWWDVNIEQGLDTYQQIEKNGGPKARGKQWIIIGPWKHDAPRSTQAGELKLVGGSNKSSESLLHGWDPLRDKFDGSLKPDRVSAVPWVEAGQDPTELPARWDSVFWVASILGRNPFYKPPAHHVLAYIVGEEMNTQQPNNTWYEFDDWPPPNTERKLYFTREGSEQKASGAEYAGLSDDQPVTGSEMHYIADPARALATRGGANVPIGGILGGVYDQRPVLKNAADKARESEDAQIIVLRGEALGERLCIAGQIGSELNVSTDAQDTDICVKLIDEYPDGRQMLIADSAMRLSWYLTQNQLGAVQPGQTYKVSLPIAQRGYVFERGHRVMLQVQGTNFPRFAINPGTGEDFYDGKGKVQHCSLQLGGNNASFVSLPVWKP